MDSLDYSMNSMHCVIILVLISIAGNKKGVNWLGSENGPKYPRVA
jgi:hypothetical protein